MQNNFMQIYLIQIYLRANLPNTVRIFERCKHVFGGLSNAFEIEGEERVWFREQKSRRRPSLISQVGAANAIPKATNLNSEIHKSFCHFRSGEQESRWRAGGTSQQDPSPAQTGTDQLRTEYWSSSVNLFLVPFLIFFLIWLPVFSSTISESYILSHVYSSNMT